MYIQECMRTHINVHMKTHVHAPKFSYSHACTHICMYACTCRYIKTFLYLHSYMKIKASALYDIEFRESNKENLSNIISWQRVILEKLINHKT